MSNFHLAHFSPEELKILQDHSGDEYMPGTNIVHLKNLEEMMKNPHIRGTILRHFHEKLANGETHQHEREHHRRVLRATGGQPALVGEETGHVLNHLMGGGQPVHTEHGRQYHGFGDFIKGAVGKVKGAVRGVVHTARGAVRGAIHTAKGVAKTAVNTARGAVRDVAGAARGVVKGAVNTATGLVGDVTGIGKKPAGGGAAQQFAATPAGQQTMGGGAAPAPTPGAPPPPDPNAAAAPPAPAA